MTDIVTTSWSEVDNNNNQTPPEGWPAGMLPNAVEPTARMNMGGVKRFWNRVNPVYVTTGGATTDTYVVTPTTAIAGLGLFETWDLRPHVNNQSTSPTLSISGFIAPIKKYVASSVTALAASDIKANKAQRLYWDGTQFIFRDTGAGSVGDLTGLGANVAAFLATPSSANLAAALTDETGTGPNVFATKPTFTNTVGIGGATASASGSGVSFPATVDPSSDANTLDDYEEGSWTPVLAGSVTPGTQTYSSQIGRYTKIGNIVNATARITLSAKDVLTVGNLTITGLPFTAYALAGLGQAIHIGTYSNIDLNAAGGYTQLVGQVAQNTTTISLIEAGDNVAAANLTEVDFGNTTDIDFSITYLSN